MISPRGCSANRIQKCIAFRNKNSNQICNRKIVSGHFCGYHCGKRKRKKEGTEVKKRALLIIINWWRKLGLLHAKKLDKCCPEYLICGETTWKQIPFIYRFQLKKNQWWDIRFLCKHFSQLLNQQDMMIPQPIFPNNPFNRCHYNPEELHLFFHRITLLKLKINIALKKFKNAPYAYWYKIIKIQKSNISNKITRYFSKSLRFKLINQSDSQCNFTGHWVLRNTPLSEFETKYRNWVKTPIYINQKNGQLIFNPERDFSWLKLWQMPAEFWDVNFDNTSVLS